MAGAPPSLTPSAASLRPALHLLAAVEHEAPVLLEVALERRLGARDLFVRPATVTLTVTPVNDAPVADAGGPYAGSVGAPVVFDGSGSSDVDGTIAGYTWDFSDGSTGSGVSPSHTYLAPGAYTVTLTATDDGGLTASATTSATIGARALSDLDIAKFSASKKAVSGKRKGVTLTLTVTNTGMLGVATAQATVVGMQNGTEVYKETLTVSDPAGDGISTFIFPSYVPTAAGDITWTAVVYDDDPDVDAAVAMTTVQQPRQQKAAGASLRGPAGHKRAR